jgi:UDP-N-acetylmuramate--alanine ligase
MPTLAVVTNIDQEHMDTYHDLADIQDAFVQFVNKVPNFGLGILCLDEPNVQAILPRLHRRFITYGFSAQADLQARNATYHEFSASFDLLWRGAELGRVQLNAPGRHHVSNALAAMAVGLELEIEPEVMIASLAKFVNADRRLQKKGEVDGILILDDYGHHPTEIRATLKTLKQGWNRRVVCVFQPHRYSRSQALMQDFFTSFNEADVLVVTDIYAAGEEPIPGVHAGTMADGIKACGHRDIIYIDKLADIPAYLMERLQPGDILLTLGAGTVWKAGMATLEMLRDLGVRTE